MDKIIKNILKKIENNGFEAYIVGGYVRDCLLGKESYDIDICTNALPKKLHEIFGEPNSSNNYGGFNLKIKKYNIDITTYRKELKYIKRSPSQIKYIDNLVEDLQRRDFTINAICMNYNNKIIDLIDGLEDINNHIIRNIGNIKEKIIEDPLRILRAVRFATILDFDIEDTLYKEIANNSLLIKNLSNNCIRKEINKILLSPNFLKGLEILKHLNILNIIGISYDNIVYINDINGMWSQLTYGDDFLFTKQEKDNITKIREVIKIGYIDNAILYKYGLYISQVAGNILNIPKNKINNMFDKLPINNKHELIVSAKDIKNALKITDKQIGIVQTRLIDLILCNKLKNNRREIKNYFIAKREELINERL